ncbi:Response regulator receiver domain-containing protein [Cyclonatronum proteinivorum]|uniref:Response regulator receiver domain-containing protein n=1 Tax=Cyclonatronum proteinivorum TaxID=1457365 RepID=A0A345ULS7_9BACT|nr:response regulator [Cyclonatronum proteinivorum]AXJ01429.1 Response regulator receiver domain-containing protein [Cyclonatronum proteinivorum]
MPVNVLIVDDEPNIVISLEFLMAQNGLTPFIARSGEQAIDFLEDKVPDVVLLDVMLPNRSGFDILQYIRRNERLKNIKVIMLTARGREQDVSKGMDLGADAYVTKPFSTRELVNKVKEFARHEP